MPQAPSAGLAQHMSVKTSLQLDAEEPAPRPRPANPAVQSTPATLAANMDREFILRNQIVDRYLVNKLPARGALDFERYCRAHPEILEDLKVTERVHAGVRLMEAGGVALPWETRPKQFWERLPVSIALALLAAGSVGAALVFHGREVNETAAIAALQKRIAEQPLDPVQGTRTMRIELNRDGPQGAAAYTIADTRAELAELKFQLGWSTLSLFRLTIDRAGQGRVMVLNNLQRDSNGELRVSLNTHLLGPGAYQLQVEGLNPRGEYTPQGWTTLTFAH